MAEEEKTLDVAESQETVSEEKESKVVEYTKPRLDLFHDVIADERERELFERHYPKKSKANQAKKDLRVAKLSNAFNNLLGSTYCELEDGTTLTVAERLAMLSTAWTLANPAPQNVLKLQELTGEAVTNVKVDTGKSISDFFKNCNADGDDD